MKKEKKYSKMAASAAGPEPAPNFSGDVSLNAMGGPESL